jgi:hypothetical protein
MLPTQYDEARADGFNSGLRISARRVAELEAEVARLKEENESLNLDLCRLWPSTSVKISELLEENARLTAALKGLHDDEAEYQRINQSGGYDNHWMRAARDVLSGSRAALDELLAKERKAGAAEDILSGKQTCKCLTGPENGSKLSA